MLSLKANMEDLNNPPNSARGNHKLSNSFSANVVKLSSSKIATQIMSLVSIPIIARLFLPEHFGTVQIFGSISSVIVVVACLRYELSIPLGKDEDEVFASFTLSLFFTSIFAFVVLALVIALRGKVAQWFKSPELAVFLWLLPVSVFAGGLGAILRCYALRKSRFDAIAWSNFGSVLGSVFVTILWVLTIGASVTGLFAGHIAINCFGVLLLFAFLHCELLCDIKVTDHSLAMLRAVAKHHRKFPIFDIWSGLFNTISIQLPPITLGLYFSKTVVGYFSLAYRFINLPVSIIGSSFGEVFFPTAAKEYNETGSISKIVSSMVKRLALIGIFPMAVIGFLGPQLFEFVFGEKWIEAGTYVQILSAWFVLVSIAAPLMDIFSILNRQGTRLCFNTAIILGRATALVIGAAILSPRWAIGMFVAFSVFSVAILIALMIKLSGVSILWAAKTVLKYLVISCIPLLLVELFSSIIGDLNVILLAILATMIYIAILFVVERAFRQIISRFLSGLSDLIAK